MGNGIIPCCAASAIAAALQHAGLDSLAPSLDDPILNSIRLNVNPSYEAAMQPGESKGGGMPDLRPSAAWPALNGAPMAFIAQVSLADAHSHDSAGLLPEQGLFLFFTTPRNSPSAPTPMTAQASRRSTSPSPARRYDAQTFPHPCQPRRARGSAACGTTRAASE